MRRAQVAQKGAGLAYLLGNQNIQNTAPETLVLGHVGMGLETGVGGLKAKFQRSE